MEDDITTPEVRGVGRRAFLGRVGGLVAATGLGLPAVLARTTRTASAAECAERGPLKGEERRLAAYDVRVGAAQVARDQPIAAPSCAGDEQRFPTGFAGYGKALPHNNLGEPDPVALTALAAAIEAGQHELFERVPLGGTRKLVNPQAAMAFALEGADSHDHTIAPPPAFDSAQRAAEMTELYWLALARDVPFSAYATDPLIGRASADLSRLSDLRAPKNGVAVTPATIFRGHTPGDLAGPYVSQFLLQDVPYGAATLVQRYRSTPEGLDFLTSYPQWLGVQRGDEVSEAPRESTARYLRNLRDLAEWVHRDFPFQAALAAAQILLAMPGTTESGNPYAASRTQEGFCTFGRPFVHDLLSRVANAGLRAAWYQKWALHRTLRPESYGGRVHNHVKGSATYPIHTDLLNASVLTELGRRQNTLLLPVSYPEGSPCHPAYPSGHATFAGASITMLKAFFDENAVVTNPVVASADGLSLTPYTGPALTVGGELNKLAANVALGRAAAGVHYRSDAIQGMLLGEAVAIRLLFELKATYAEPFGTFSLTRFDGTRVAI